MIKHIVFDLDDTLVVEVASAEEAFLATCERAHEQYGIDPKGLHQAVRHRAGQLWRASATITYCRSIESVHGKVSGLAFSVTIQI